MKKEKNYVFIISLILTGGIALWAVALNDSFTKASDAVYAFLTQNFGWLYLIAMFFFVIFVIAMAFSKYGKVKLGADDSKPEYSTVSWFAMLFGAGMGVGLVFWGISEPISHYINPMGMEGGTEAAADFAMRSSFMHWGIHPWANYAIIGLALAYFQFRKNKPGLVSSIFEPLIGEKRVQGFWGKLIDVLAVFATVAGVTTSLGLGVLQINSGLNYLFGIPTNLVIQIIIIVVISIIYIWSAVAGIEKGIKLVSDANLYIALALMILVFLVGPKIEIFNSFTNGLGEYLGNFIPDSLGINSYGDNSWIEGWRVFYWAWWIAWAPFVGVFIARISKGRTIREFIAGVVVAPSLGSLVWFGIFGTLGINLGEKGILSLETLKEVAAVPETGLFVVMREYPFGTILSVIAMVLLCTFFITSANSGTFVLSMLSSKGDLNPPNSKKVLWGIVQSVMAIGLLIAGGLKPLQIISIAAAFPFIFIMLFASASLLKALKQEKL
ncbi:glycine betaine transporter [Aequitasia blattaphilus]|uniref:BCCT family transporter n=1 Tax=Aequitasia blattaphilus TaxID=2949332 RepID=A0ABT1EB82_9FIRM|nr:BCCT family transporter [Aequitasia blattaphilus]MCP1103093.1 BCCT family transporter [Aequitasia blattaphilus]MCR8615733.1 BCCT family transporter [Aequitasia blattaphilus]